VTWLLLLLAYLLGSIPSSYLMGRLARGVDLRDHGSGNLGAANTFRVLGWRAAAPVIVVDVAKGWAPTALFPLWNGVETTHWALAYGGAAILGHLFSVFVRFKGGKGVATSAGVFLALAPWAVLIAFVVWGVTVVLTRIVSVGSLLAAVVLPLAVFVTAEPRPVFWVSLVLCLLVIFAHRENIRRLARGTEKRLGRSPERAG
jgi:acyl phosphate:glycerol-3-phosphate acyltransferase